MPPTSDSSPYHGWLFAYDAATFVQKSVYVTTPNGGMGGFWMTGGRCGGGRRAENIFIPSGNGTFDNTKVPVETGDTILKTRQPPNQTLTLLDYFNAPRNSPLLDGNDLDLGSGGVLLVSESTTRLVPEHPGGSGKRGEGLRHQPGPDDD